MKKFGISVILCLSSLLSAQNKQQIDAFYTAIRENNFPLVKKIVDQGFPIKTTLPEQTAPVLAAIWKKNFPMVKYLVEKGANITAEKKLVDGAIEYGSPEITFYLIQKGAYAKNALYTAIFYENFEIAKELYLNHQPQIIDNEDPGKLLLLAVKSKDLEFIKKLPLKKKNSPMDFFDYDGYNALLLAVEKNDTEIAKYLLSQGADKKSRITFETDNGTVSGKTALQMAKANKNAELLKLLK
ncbi:ankyrin repeat domain-containing protein [Chryseobacterium sp. BIGb0232]|uniref:ankyrin repeat domain-containing protein n=1 Tax=Chryseobacterium sp. BIGb0232 TaxID=2940598 RepID=UPI000F488EC8|nr:ankyrin repeat domain-containing protein [Chryseobacterium sp. BIGb0232]MCS4301540.1 ankyrin repeat protein [Chryseobacterium sp. BIGb0232]ROS19605.1 ankyrin repeat protein [Chryseobacterium nakagawai]